MEIYLRFGTSWFILKFESIKQLGHITKLLFEYFFMHTKQKLWPQ
jgi:hypothetical protein